MVKVSWAFAAVLLTVSHASPWALDATRISIDLKSTQEISPLLWGIFFEEINHAGDGGLYAELCADRSFEGTAHALSTGGSEAGPWAVLGDSVMSLMTQEPLSSSNPVYARVGVTSGSGGLVNSGYWGIPINGGQEYHIALYVRTRQGATQQLQVRLTDGAAAANLGSTVLHLPPAAQQGWVRVSGSIIAATDADEPNGRLVLTFSGPAILDLDFISLWPGGEVQGSGSSGSGSSGSGQAAHGSSGSGGSGQAAQQQLFRPDVLQMLRGLAPRFIRFPGGCYVEGAELHTSFRWKAALGPPEQRPGHWNSVWGYWSSDGLGLYEYLLLAEQLGAAPVWVVNAGIAHKESVPSSQLWEPWLQDTLDGLEFANGPPDSEWGRIRASMGHPAPFQLLHVAVGNENCGYPDYERNYLLFAGAIRASYPAVKLITNCWPADELPADLGDYHMYCSADDMWALRNHFDATPRGPGQVQVFVSEFAVVGNKGNLRGAIAEAGFMAGLERNGDAVGLAAYAPLLAHIRGAQWWPNAIVFNNSKAYGTPSYWVQHMFAQHFGPWYASTDVQGDVAHVAASTTCKDERCSRVAVKMVNYNDAAVAVHLDISAASHAAHHTGGGSGGGMAEAAVSPAQAEELPAGLGRGEGRALQAMRHTRRSADRVGGAAHSPSRLWVLTGSSGADENSLEEADKVVPRLTQLPLLGPDGSLEVTLPPMSLSVLLLESAPALAAAAA